MINQTGCLVNLLQNSEKNDFDSTTTTKTSLLATNDNLKIKSFSCFELTDSNNSNNNMVGIDDDLDFLKLNKKDIERFNILKEILSSEKKYLNDLQEIVKVIKNILIKSKLKKPFFFFCKKKKIIFNF
jgi:hypothetical protein